MQKQENLKKREHSLTNRVDDQCLQSKMSSDEESNDGSECSSVSSVKADQSEQIENRYEEVIGRLQNIDNNKIGQFDSSNVGFHQEIRKPMSEIKADRKAYDYIGITEDVMALTAKSPFLEAFSNLRKIYEFIFHMHYAYGVKLSSELSPEKDKLLRETLNKSICKFIQRPNGLFNT